MFRSQKTTILAAYKRVWNPTRHPQLLQLLAPPTSAISLENIWNLIYFPITDRVWEPNLAPTSSKVPNPIQLYPAHLQVPLTSLMLYLGLAKLLLSAIRYGIDIVVA